MLERTTLALAALLATAGWAGAHGGERTVEESYRAPTAPLLDTRCEGPLEGTGACFEVHAHDETVRLEVDDRFSDPVAARYAFVGPGGIVHDADTFCGVTHLVVPSLDDDAPVDRLRVTSIATGDLSADCTGGPGTAGTVTATFAFGVEGD